MRETLRRLWLILTLQCEHASRLMSDALDRPLPWHERWAVRLHEAVCRSCRHFRRQLELLRLAARTAPPAPGLTEAAKDRLRLLLREGRGPA